MQLPLFRSLLARFASVSPPERRASAAGRRCDSACSFATASPAEARGSFATASPAEARGSRVLACFAALLFWVAALSAQPVVTVTSVEQIPGSKWVRIVYNLSTVGAETVTVHLEASRDGGATYAPVLRSTISGDSATGGGQRAGADKVIIWNAGGMPWPPEYIASARVRVVAAAEDPVPPDAVLVDGWWIARTAGTYPPEEDWEEAVADELGESWRVLDWTRLKSLTAAEPAAAEAVADLIGASAFIERDGERRLSHNQSYFATAHYGSLPGYYGAHDEIGGHMLSLGAWDLNLPILAVRPAASGLPDLTVASLETDRLVYGLDEPIVVTAVVRNIGEAVAPPSQLRFAIGGESHPPSFDIPALAPWQSHSVTRETAIGLERNMGTTAMIDPENLIPEADAENNSRTHYFFVRESPVACLSEFPPPRIALGPITEYVAADGALFLSYAVEVTNHADYPDELFAASEDLPPCGENPVAARTWVTILDGDGRHVFAFCALEASANLRDLWFPVPVGQSPPAAVQVVLTDRLCGEELASDFVAPGAPTRILRLAGDLAFGEVTIGESATRTLTIHNDGNSELTVSGISYPSSRFSGDWSGPIGAGDSQPVTVTFAPQSWHEGAYSGELTVDSNATGGTNTHPVSGRGIAAAAPMDFIAVTGGFLPSISSFGDVLVADFHLARHELTWAQWREGRAWAVARGYDIGAGQGCDDDHPVHTISWYDAVKWCNAMSERDGLTPVYRLHGEVFRTGTEVPTWDRDANGYRLPAEMEWEFAARGGNLSEGYVYSGSDNLDDVGWFAGNSGGAACDLFDGLGTWPVGLKAANELGFYDMSGNVFEWCWEQTGPGAVIRGGRWDLDELQNRVSWRNASGRHAGSNVIGLRVARGAFSAVTPTRILRLSGDLTFGNVTVGQSDTRTLTIHNDGNSPLNVSSISYPAGFSGNWNSGPITAGGSRSVTVTFSPPAAQSYSGNLTVNSDRTSGTNTRAVSGTGVGGGGVAPAGMVIVEGGTLSTSNPLDGTQVATFYIGIYEVTWGEWKAVRAEAAARGYDIGSVGAGCADDHPVHSVSWFDVLKWCNLKSEINGLTAVYTVGESVFKTGQPDHTTITQNLSANGYRLPLEAEWEFAARGGNQTNGYTYAGSNDLNAVGWYWDNSGGAACNLSSGRGTWPVGQKASNELGLYDMSGNVWEWCWDRWSDIISYRRIRGGSWYNFAGYATVSVRNIILPDYRSFNGGFRLARSSGN